MTACPCLVFFFIKLNNFSRFVFFILLSSYGQLEPNYFIITIQFNPIHFFELNLINLINFLVNSILILPYFDMIELFIF